MEGLIIMVITFVVGTLINASKKKQQNPQPMPPFNNNQPATQKQSEGRKSLQDFAEEVFQQLNDKAQPEPSVEPIESQPETIRPTEIAEKNVESQRHSRPILDDNRRSNRNSTITVKTTVSDAIMDNEIGKFIPTTKKALVQAIITSEILGPPKAKQR